MSLTSLVSQRYFSSRLCNRGQRCSELTDVAG